MRVLMLAQFYAPIVGGEERMVESLALTLTERGHDVAVATLHQPGQSDFELIRGIRVHRLPGTSQRFPWLYSEEDRRHAPPLPDPETTLALRRVLEAERPEVVHAHNWIDSAYLPLERRSSAAYVVSLHDFSLICANKRLMRGNSVCEGPSIRACAVCTAHQYGTLVGPVVGVSASAASWFRRRRADLLLPVSQYVADTCGLASGPTPYEVIPNFLVNPGSATEPAAGDLDLPDEPFILVAGDLSVDKGLHVLLEAHAGMRNQMPLVAIGRKIDPSAEMPPANVSVLGPRPHADVTAAWQRCAIAVVPSLQREAFGLVALEAMRAGKPVVVAGSGGLREVVADGVSGIVVEPGNPGELRDALDRLAEDRELREALGRGALLRADELTAAAIVPRVEAAYVRAIEHRAARRGSA